MEIEQLKEKLSRLEGKTRPSGAQNAGQLQSATINPALLMLKPEATAAGSASGVPAPAGTPERWQAQLTGLPTVEAPAEAMSTPFSRSFLSAQLGGGTQGVVMRVSATNDKVRLKEFNITRYYCPNAQGNPWLPKLPGMHGFMFVGMGALDSTIGTDECCEMFIGMGTNDWRYFGNYRCTRMEPLTVDEFQNLTPAMQTTYCKFTVAKQLASTVPDAMSKYASGELRVPCVRLACQMFNLALFDSLRASSRATVNVLQATPSPSAKRQRQMVPVRAAASSESPAGPSRRASGRLQQKGPVSYADGDDNDDATMVEDHVLDESPSAKRPRLDGPGWSLMLHPSS
ncbi:hypothetical protein AURDEDRAFT_79396 [Auricularia subglabra TFB-10046 SS5]|nr:hypothetical protein AURDEDRAFT_79396 [Auricularia subglabra TFB-10046 SS5]